MEFDGYPLNSKMIQDILRKESEGYHHRLIETKLSENTLTKMDFQEWKCH